MFLDELKGKVTQLELFLELSIVVDRYELVVEQDGGGVDTFARL